MLRCPSRTPAQAEPKPLLLSKTQTPFSIQALGSVFLSTGQLRPSFFQKKISAEASHWWWRQRVQTDVVCPPAHRKTFTVKTANVA